MAKDRERNTSGAAEGAAGGSGLPRLFSTPHIEGMMAQVAPEYRAPFVQLLELVALYEDNPHLADGLLAAIERIGIYGVPPEWQLAELRKLLEQWGPGRIQS